MRRVDLALLLLTAVLAVATLVYAGFAGWAAWEMRSSRLLGLRPRLALRVRPYSDTGGHLALRNVGGGTALDVSVTIKFDGDDLNEARPWRADVLAPGEEVVFMFPQREPGGTPLNFAALQTQQVRARVHGTMDDIDGKPHVVEDEIDAAQWSREAETAVQLFEGDDAKRIGDELEKIRKALSKKPGPGSALGRP